MKRRKRRAPAGLCCFGAMDVQGLWALVAVHQFKLDRVTFVQRLEAGAADASVMHEDILAPALLDKTESLFIVKPLHSAGVHNSPSLRSRAGADATGGIR